VLEVETMNEPKLNAMFRELQKSVESVSIRGEGTSSFLYATSKGRSVEISAHQEGGWWLEFWEATADEDAPPVRESIAETSEKAIAETIGWLG
jgi:hypothetical protein